MAPTKGVQDTVEGILGGFPTALKLAGADTAARRGVAD
ncbi:hypothetical protein PF006_g13901 [Phytophthora fragariae]|uniref:Uncharacterized protein n=1 Tax=Phytophthora fragariae TaxID=53985 RepID=A0A6A3TKV2_9STRA|nr:hypothetical protein PF003_g33054 [Phytophthora fragariae]KAE9138722.1 hypothetical protein PF006_g13901 [Phytophthora fragariae]